MMQLETKGLCRGFGGLQAVAGVDLALPAKQIRALIGPNGAGKTTLVSLISGRLQPSAGRILFEGEDITGLRGDERVMRGIVYTFQITSIFKNLTVHDNVALAAQRRLTLQRSVLKLDQSELRGGDTWDRKIRGQVATCALFAPPVFWAGLSKTLPRVSLRSVASLRA